MPLASCRQGSLTRRLAALALLLCSAAPAVAESVELSPAQLRAQAGRAVDAGAPAMALEMTSALLARDAGDAEALVLRSRALRDMGRNGPARATAARAWDAAETGPQRYAAALVMAQALSSSGQRTLSQVWLRRAVQHAPDDAARARAVRDFRYVRSRNPLSLDLSFNVAPTSNLNNGSVSSTTRLFDLPFEYELTGDALALSGVEYSGGLALRYRLSGDRTQRTDLLLRTEHRTYTLSDEAQAMVPDKDGADYAFTSASVGILRQGITGPEAPGPYQIWAMAGRNWYAGEPYFDFLRAGAQQSFTVSDRARAYLTASREQQSGHGGRDDAGIWSLAAGIDRATDAGRLGFSVSTQISQSDNSNLDYRRIGARIDYALAEPVMGMELELGLSAAKKDHETSAFTAAGRHDTEWGASVTAVFRQADLYGFVPSLTYSWRRTSSNIGLFDSETQGLELGIRSAF